MRRLFHLPVRSGIALVQSIRLAAAVAACAVLLASPSCQRQHQAQPSGTDAAGGSAQATKPSDSVKPEAQSGDPKQVILIYTGDTLSAANPEPQGETWIGGLCALTSAIGRYEAQIVDYNRKRVENAGGDPSGVKADFAHGMLGEHPYLLLDYGGWSRPNDPAGSVYVGLYFRMFSDLHYSAVGCKLYERLTPERWRQYRQLEHQPTLLVTTGQAQAATIPTERIFTRQMHDELWGVISVPLPQVDFSRPLPETAQTAREKITQAVEQAAAAAQAAGCNEVVLMLSEGPAELYKSLSEDQRFAVVIGAPPRMAPPEGFGKLPEKGPLMLPDLAAGGQEVGVCHLIYSTEGTRPSQYFFARIKCVDRAEDPLPYRQQVAQAREEHLRLVQPKPPPAK